MKSKTIILSSENEKGRGILTLFEEDGLLQCRIRLYNIEKLNRFCKLGIYHEKQVYSANLLEKNGVYTSSMVGDFDIDQDFYSAIIDTQNNNNVILSGGTYAGFFFNDNSVFDERVSNNHVFDNVKKENPNTNLYDYDNELETQSNPQQDFISEENNNFDSSSQKQTSYSEVSEMCDKCANCKYKEFFYSRNNFDDDSDCNHDNETSLTNINASHELKEGTNLGLRLQTNLQTSNSAVPDASQEDNNSNSIIIPSECNESSVSHEIHSIAESLVPQFKYVFENYPQDEILNALIPNSKFVKIEENNNNYSIGAIYQEEEMKYICYAVMCDYNAPVPNEIGPHYQWLPIDKEDPLSEGYYIVFQDTQDLKIVEL